MAETRAEAERAFERFLATYSAKYPKATVNEITILAP